MMVKPGVRAGGIGGVRTIIRKRNRMGWDGMGWEDCMDQNQNNDRTGQRQDGARYQTDSGMVGNDDDEDDDDNNRVEQQPPLLYHFGHS